MWLGSARSEAWESYISLVAKSITTIQRFPADTWTDFIIRAGKETIPKSVRISSDRMATCNAYWLTQVSVARREPGPSAQRSGEEH